jgi:hypothetical protein
MKKRKIQKEKQTGKIDEWGLVLVSVLLILSGPTLAH